MGLTLDKARQLIIRQVRIAELGRYIRNVKKCRMR
jgi:hypothetical protein